jgi:hypothetical protein
MNIFYIHFTSCPDNIPVVLSRSGKQAIESYERRPFSLRYSALLAKASSQKPVAIQSNEDEHIIQYSILVLVRVYLLKN